MSRTIQPTSETTSTEGEEEIVWPEFNPSTGYRGFIERLRRARLARGLSISDMADEVGLHFKLAYEFESIAAPLPFEFMSVWCDVVGVPFDDFLAIYWADEEAYALAKEAKEREAEQPGIHETPSITSTEAGAPEAPNTGFSSLNRGGGLLSTLRAACDHISRFFRSRFSTPKETLG